jgi:hypothetical protein
VPSGIGRRGAESSTGSSETRYHDQHDQELSHCRPPLANDVAHLTIRVEGPSAAVNAGIDLATLPVGNLTAKPVNRRSRRSASSPAVPAHKRAIQEPAMSVHNRRVNATRSCGDA